MHAPIHRHSLSPPVACITGLAFCVVPIKRKKKKKGGGGKGDTVSVVVVCHLSVV